MTILVGDGGGRPVDDHAPFLIFLVITEWPTEIEPTFTTAPPEAGEGICFPDESIHLFIVVNGLLTQLKA